MVEKKSEVAPKIQEFFSNGERFRDLSKSLMGMGLGLTLAGL